MTRSLEDLGFTESEGRALVEAGHGRAACARVVTAERGHVAVIGEGADRTLTVPGALRGAGRAPITGDWVVFDDRSVVVAVLPRRTAFVRRAAGARAQAQTVAANVDVAFVLTGLDGDFNLRRIERYLTLVQESGARPVLLLTKAGRADDVGHRLTSARQVAPAVPVHAIDVIDGVDADAPLTYVPRGVTAAVLGSSGVGKSTLVNYMLGDAVARTASVRERDDRGVHTTTRRELHVLPGGGLVIDTPGMREIALWGDRAAVDAAFPDVVERALTCRFRDCGHGAEPGCAVQGAALRGEVPSARVESYRRLVAEIEATDRARTERQRRSVRRR